MKTRAIVCVLAPLMMMGVSCRSSGPVIGGCETGNVNESAAVVAADFDALIGPTWNGTLTYLDYTSNRPTTIRSTLRVTEVSPGVWSWATGYNDEPHADSAVEVKLVEDGRGIAAGGVVERVVSRRRESEAVEIVTERAGSDNERPAQIRMTYEISSGKVSVRKLVKPEGAAEYFQRNEYKWTR